MKVFFPYLFLFFSDIHLGTDLKSGPFFYFFLLILPTSRAIGCIPQRETLKKVSSNILTLSFVDSSDSRQSLFGYGNCHAEQMITPKMGYLRSSNIHPFVESAEKTEYFVTDGLHPLRHLICSNSFITLLS